MELGVSLGTSDNDGLTHAALSLVPLDLYENTGVMKLAGDRTPTTAQVNGCSLIS